MKKNKFTEFFKGKGYYVLLFVGVVAIAAVAVIGSQLSSNSGDDNNLVDINDTDNNLAAGDEDIELAENNPISDGIVNNAGSEDIAANDNTTNNSVAEGDDTQDVASGPEMEGYDEDNVTNSGNEDELAGVDEAGEVAQAGETVEASTSTAQNETNETVESLSFSVEEGLMWPVQGNVIMDYSVDHTVYFATLMEYKVNPAIIVDAEVGDEVKAAATGVVTKVEEKTENAETGLTVTMDIGDGYSLVYGQLADVNLKVGDLVHEGDVIATVAEPTKYYSVEGSNLYFQVLENDQTVNPMLLLR